MKHLKLFGILMLMVLLSLTGCKDKTPDNKTTITSLEEVEKIMNEKPGFVNAHWCGNEECELKMKEIRGTKSRCILEEKPIGDKCVCCGKPAKHLVVWGIQY